MHAAGLKGIAQSKICCRNPVIGRLSFVFSGLSKIEMRRIKLYANDISDPRFRCFGCCHVRTGAICLGFYHLVRDIAVSSNRYLAWKRISRDPCLQMIQVVAISALLFAISRPDIFCDNNGEMTDDTAMGKIADNTKYPVQNGREQKATQLPELPTPQPQKSAQAADSDRFFYTKSDVMVFTRKRLQNGT